MNKMVSVSVIRIINILAGQAAHNYLSEACEGATLGDESKDEVQSAMRDLVTDIIHFSREKGLDFDRAVAAARTVAGEEL